MLVDHGFLRAASPSSSGRVEDASVAWPKTISSVIAVSLSGALVACI
jgi:hypothetical protein